MNLSNIFNKAIYDIGLNTLENPIFYNAPVGIRFEIGGEDEIYIKKGLLRKLKANPKYIDAACRRAMRIWKALPQNNWLLRIDVYSQIEMDKVCKKLQLDKSKELVKRTYFEEEEDVTHYELYWAFDETKTSIGRLIKEIVLADLGGLNSLASAVYLLNPKEKLLYHLYDDRGLDLVAKDKAKLFIIYEKYNEWILAYDRELIDDIFKKIDTSTELKDLLTFLNQLEKNKIYYRLNKIREEAIMVEVTVPGQKWEIEFLDDGTVDIEKFISNQDLYDVRELDVLLEEFVD